LDAIVALAPSDLPLTDTLSSLVRKDLVRPAGDDTFRFKHLLLRDAAYEALPKEQRADLHERFAAWLEYANPDLGEIIGYHLEQAYRFRAELGPVDERTQELARRAATLLAAAGRKASTRTDIPATINLLERSVRLLPDQDADAVALYPTLASAISEAGDFQRPEELYRTAEELGDEVTALRARLGRIWLSLHRGADMAAAVGPLEATVADAERLEDEATLADALRRSGVLAMWLGDNEKAEQLLRRALQHTESIGDVRLKSEAVFWIALVLLWGPTPVEKAIQECQRLSESIEVDQMARSELLVVQGTLLALTGEFDRGRQLVADGRLAYHERGQTVQYAATAQPMAVIELLAGDAPAAERLLSEAHEILFGAGERGYLSTVSGMLALALAKQERFEEAELFAEEGRRIGAEEDVITQVYCRVAMAHVAAAKGQLDEAARLASQAMDLAGEDASFDRPMAAMEIAGFLEPDARRAALERALSGASAKGNVVTAQQARELLAALP
jgi:tetratricopeptide (TPR) repeat protein